MNAHLAAQTPIDRTAAFTRSTLVVIWTVSLAGLGLWFLLAWGGYAVVSDSSAWLFALIDPWIASATWEARLASLLAWGERLGSVAVWAVWALGTVGLLLTSVFASWLYVRAQRAMSAAR